MRNFGLDEIVRCTTKQAVRNARYEKVRLACTVDGGHRMYAERMPNGDIVEAIVLGEINNLVCVHDALKFKKRERANMSVEELFDHLQPCNWDLEPWDDSQPVKERVPGLYIYVASVENSTQVLATV